MKKERGFEDFISAYKQLENTLRLRDMKVIDYENTLPEEDKKKLQLCRITRNYIQHEYDYKDFCSMSNGMIEFLEEKNNEILQEMNIMKKHIYKPKGTMMFDTDTCLSAIDTLVNKFEIKVSQIYVYETKYVRSKGRVIIGCYILPIRKIISQYIMDKKSLLSSVNENYRIKPTYISGDTLLRDCTHDTCLCTKTGDENVDEILGVYYKKGGNCDL